MPWTKAVNQPEEGERRSQVVIGQRRHHGRNNNLDQSVSILHEKLVLPARIAPFFLFYFLAYFHLFSLALDKKSNFLEGEGRYSNYE